MARKTIANLNIQLSAGTAVLRRDFRQAQAAASRFGAGIRRQQTVMRRFAQVSRRAVRSISAALTTLKAKLAPLLAMGTALVATAVGVRAVARQFKELDKSAKAARTLELSIGEFRGFGLAAEKAGISADQFGTALERMMRGIGQAVEGKGAASAAFEKLGLDAQKLAQMGPADALREIAEAFGQVDTQAERLALTADIFGRSAGEMARLLAEGRGDLERSAEAMERLQGKISALDTQRVEEANDALEEMKLALEGVAVQLALALAPTTKDVAEAMTEMAIQTRKMFEENREAITLFARVMGELTIIVVKLHPLIILLTNSIRYLQTALELTGLDKFFRQLPEDLEEAAGRMDGATAAAKRMAAAVAGATTDIQSHANELDEANRKWEEFARALEREYRTPFEVAVDRVEELNKALRKGGLDWDVYTRAVEDAVEQLAEASGATEKAARQSMRIGRVGAVTSRTTAGFSAVHGANDAVREAARLHRESLREQKEHTRILQDIRDELPIQVREVSLR